MLPKKYSDSIFWLGGFVLVILIICKSAILDFTHDEAYSFHNIKKFWYAEFLCTGNSHWINSGAMKISSLFGLEKPWELRWFSSLSFILFTFFGIRWVISREKFSERLFAFSILFLFPYALDFFSLARGYAGALMFELSSLIVFDLALKTQKKKYFHWSLIFSAAAAFSNFGFIYFFVAFALIYFSRQYFPRWKLSLKQKGFYFDLLLTISTGLIIARAFLFMIRCSNDVVGAGDENLIRSFQIFAEGLIYQKAQINGTPLNIISGIILGLTIISSLYGISFPSRHKNQFYHICSSVFVLMIAVMIINYFGFGIVFPYSRSSLIFFPLIAILISHFIFYGITNSAWKMAVSIFSSTCLVINFIFSFQFKSVMEYSQQSQTKICFQKLEELKADNVGIAPDLYGVYINYYQMTENHKFSFHGYSCWPQQNVSLKSYDYLLLNYPWFGKGVSFGNKKPELVYIDPITKNIIVQLQ